MEEPAQLTVFHRENEEYPLSKKAAITLIKGAAHNGGIDVLGDNGKVDEEGVDCCR